jgi:hypothetical protein
MSHVTAIKQELLQTRLDGALKTPQQVLEIVRRHQPTEGLDNSQWQEICGFILGIEKADNIPAARVVAVEHQLNIAY